jgi:hypothetical protein
MVNFNSIKLLYNSPMIQVLVNLIFSDCVFYIVIFNLLGPAVVEVMNFASNLATIFEIVGFVHLRVASFTEYTQNQVAILQNSKLVL